jgi:hypothetical protein
MTKPFDLSKFRKSLTKSIDGLGIGFKDPTEWVSTGNYALNYLISGDFNRGVPLGKVTMLAGESGCLPSTARVRVRHGSHADPQTITVGQLKVLHTNGQTPLEISTPDGFHPITDWFDKGPLPMVRLTANNGLTTDCAVNHLLQRDDNSWVPAGAVQVGDCLLTELGLTTVDSFKRSTARNVSTLQLTTTITDTGVMAFLAITQENLIFVPVILCVMHSSKAFLWYWLTQKTHLTNPGWKR